MIEFSFTLIAVSFVLMMIAYSVSIVRMSDAKSVLAEMEGYISSLAIFRERYHARPGDLKEAEKFFSGVAAISGNQNDRWDTKTERNIAWPQLYQAGLMSQNLSGEGDISAPGVNRPVTTLKYGGWTFMDSLSVKPPGGVEKVTINNVLRIGGANNDEYLKKGILTINDHIFIDSKIDSPGTPISGRYIVGESECIEEIAVGSNLYGYSSNPDLKCTGNIAEVGSKN